MKKKFNVLKLVLSPFITIFIMLAIFYLNDMYPWGERSLAHADMSYHTVPLLNTLKDILEGRGSFFLNFEHAGGMNFYGVFFFMLASPFNALSFFVDKEKMMQFINVIVILKMATCAFTASYCLSYLFKKLRTSSIVFLSLLYPFSSYVMMYYINVIWLDMMYIFPLLIVGLIRIIEENDSRTYIISLTLSCLANFYLTYMTAIFIFIFSLVYFLLNYREKNSASAIRNILFSSSLVLLITSVVWLPCFLQYTQSYRSSVGIINNIKSVSLLFHQYANSIPILMGSAFPLVILLLNFNRTRANLEKLFYTLFLLMLIPFVVEPINLIWHGGNYMFFPCRFGYITVFLAIICAGYVGENLAGKERTKINLHTVGYFTFYVIFWICSWLFIRNLLHTNNNLFNYIINYFCGFETFGPLLKVFTLFFLCYAVPYWLFVKQVFSYKILMTAIFGTLLLEIFFYTSIYMGCVAQVRYSSNNLSNGIYKFASTFHDQSNFYRVKTDFSADANFVGSVGCNSLSHYTSLTDARYMNVMKRLGYGCHWVFVGVGGGTYLTDALLCVKYQISCDYEQKKYELSQFRDRLPLGVFVSSAEETNFDKLDRVSLQEYLSNYLFQENLLKRYSSAERGKVFDYVLDLKGKRAIYLDLHEYVADILVNGKSVIKNFDLSYGNILHLGDFADEKLKVSVRFNKDVDCSSFCLFGLDMERLYELCQQARGANLNVKGCGLYGRCNVAKDSTLFLSVPYNDGFTVKVNGVKVPYKKALTGFISFDLPRGEDEIEITFVPKGFCLGMVISGLGLVLSFLYIKFANKLNYCVWFNKVMAGVMVFVSTLVFVGVYVVPVVIKIFGA